MEPQLYEIGDSQGSPIKNETEQSRAADELPGLPYLPPGSTGSLQDHDPPVSSQSVLSDSKESAETKSGRSRIPYRSSFSVEAAPSSRPIVTRPQRGCNASPSTNNWPRSLQYLSTLNKLCVKQKVEVLEALFGHESANKFAIYDGNRLKIFSAEEDSNYLERQCFGSFRSLKINVADNRGCVVLNFKRANYSTMQVFAPPVNMLGVVEMESYVSSTFKIKDLTGSPVLYIKGPTYTGHLGGNVEFKVFSPDGNTQVGMISKKWGGLVTEMRTDKDNFEITFRADMDVRHKIYILAAMFLIDMVFYENNN